MHPKELVIADFTYHLPDERIARYPLAQRDASKLLVFKNGRIQDTVFSELGAQLPPNCRLVFNETKVISARLLFLNANQQPIEVFCLEPASGDSLPALALAAKGEVVWKCMVGHLKRWKHGPLTLEKNGSSLRADFLERKDALVVVKFSWQPAEKNFADILQEFGNLPIPPYLNRRADESDDVNYQTVYSKQAGSVAAPTAGLHFTPRVFDDLASKNIVVSKLVLHVGAGTFQPVKSETVGGHQMHAEFIEVPKQLIQDLINASGERVIAVGTTAMRTLESLYWMGLKAFHKPSSDLAHLEVGQWDPYEGNLELCSNTDSLQALLNWMETQGLDTLVCKTQILIAPPYDLKIVSGIVTNFHQPQSTLLLLISAIIGENWKKVYEHALSNGYRFLSYGDSSLLLK